MSQSLRTIESGRQNPNTDGATEALRIMAFWGGNDDGACVQLTIGREFVQFTRDNVRELMTALTLWDDPNITTRQAARFLSRVDDGAYVE
jgi:hypothetical protein